MYEYYNINVLPERLRKIREARMKEYEREHKEPECPGKRGRRPNRFSQDNLAKDMFIPRGSVIAWESGASKPTLDELVKLCRLLDCDLDYLLGRCDTYHRECAEISEATGLSTEAVDTLRKWKRLSNGECVPSNANDISQGCFGLKTLNSLLTNDEGLEVLTNVGLYLHGRLRRRFSEEEQARIEHAFMYMEDLSLSNASAKKKKKVYISKEDLLLSNYTVTFEIEDSNMVWTMATEKIKSMLFSMIQESLVNLKARIGNSAHDHKELNLLMLKAKKPIRGGSADGNGEEAR